MKTRNLAWSPSTLRLGRPREGARPEDARRIDRRVDQRRRLASRRSPAVDEEVDVLTEEPRHLVGARARLLAGAVRTRAGHRDRAREQLPQPLVRGKAHAERGEAAGRG